MKMKNKDGSGRRIKNNGKILSMQKELGRCNNMLSPT
jgi:hypothetical protein